MSGTFIHAQKQLNSIPDQLKRLTKWLNKLEAEQSKKACLSESDIIEVINAIEFAVSLIDFPAPLSIQIQRTKTILADTAFMHDLSSVAFTALYYALHLGYVSRTKDIITRLAQFNHGVFIDDPTLSAIAPTSDYKMDTCAVQLEASRQLCRYILTQTAEDHELALEWTYIANQFARKMLKTDEAPADYDFETEVHTIQAVFNELKEEGQTAHQIVKNEVTDAFTKKELAVQLMPFAMLLTPEAVPDFTLHSDLSLKSIFEPLSGAVKASFKQTSFLETSAKLIDINEKLTHEVQKSQRLWLKSRPDAIATTTQKMEDSDHRHGKNRKRDKSTLQKRYLTQLKSTLDTLANTIDTIAESHELVGTDKHLQAVYTIINILVVHLIEKHEILLDTTDSDAIACQERFIHCCASLMQQIDENHVLANLTCFFTGKEDGDRLTLDLRGKECALFCALLWHLKSEQREEDKTLLKHIAYFRMTHPLIVEPSPTLLNFVCDGKINYYMFEQAKENHLFVRLIYQAINGEEVRHIDGSPLESNTSLNRLTSKIQEQYNNIVTYEERFNDIINAEQKAQEVALTAYLDQKAKDQHAKNDIEDEGVEETKGDEALKKEPTATTSELEKMQHLVFKAFRLFKACDFNKAQQVSASYIKHIEELKAKPEEKLCLITDLKLQLAKAMMPSLTKSKHAGKIANLPKETLIEFEAALSDLMAADTSSPSTLGLITVFNDIRQTMSDYCIIIDNYRRRHNELKAAVTSHRALHNQCAYNSLKSTGVMNDDELNPDYKKPTKTQNTKNKSGKKNRKKQQGPRKAELVSSCRQLLKMDHLADIQTDIIKKAIVRRKEKAASSAGAGMHTLIETNHNIDAQQHWQDFEMDLERLVREDKADLTSFTTAFENFVSYLESPRLFDKQIKVLAPLPKHLGFLSCAFSISLSLMEAGVFENQIEQATKLMSMLLRFYIVLSRPDVLYKLLKLTASDTPEVASFQQNLLACFRFFDYLLVPSEETKNKAIMAIGTALLKVSGKETPAKTADELKSELIEASRITQSKEEPKDVSNKFAIASLNKLSLLSALTIPEHVVWCKWSDGKLKKLDGQAFIDSLFHDTPKLDSITPPIYEKAPNTKDVRSFNDELLLRAGQASSVLRDYRHEKHRKQTTASNPSDRLITHKQKVLNEALERLHKSLSKLTEQKAAVSPFNFFMEIHSVTKILSNYIHRKGVNIASTFNTFSKSQQAKLIDCCVTLMQHLNPSILLSSLRFLLSNELSMDKKLSVDYNFRSQTVLLAYLYYLSTKQTEKDKVFLERVAWFYATYHCWIPIQTNLLRLPTREQVHQKIKLRVAKDDLTYKLVWKALTGEKLSFNKVSTDGVSHFFNTLSTQISKQYISHKNAEANFYQLLDEENQKQSEKLKQYIDQTLSKAHVSTNYEITTEPEPEEDMEESKSAPPSPTEQMQLMAYKSINAFRTLSFDQASTLCEEQIKKVENLDDATPEEKLCLRIDLQLQLARAMISRLNNNPKAGEIAQIPNKALIDFEASLLALTTVTSVNPVLIGIFKEIRQIMSDYCQVIERFRIKHEAICESIQAQWERARASGDFSGKLFEGKSKSPKTYAYKSLEASKVIENQVLNPEYTAPSRHLSVAQDVKKKNKQMTQVVNITESIKQLLALEALEAPDTTQIDAAIGTQDKLALAGAGGPPPKPKKKHKKPKPDTVSDKINEHLNELTKDFKPDFKRQLRIYGGALRDWYLGECANDVDARFQGSVADFKKHNLMSPFFEGTDGVSTANTKIIKGKMTWDISIHRHKLGKANFDFNVNALIARLEGSKWRVRTFNGNIVEPDYFTQKVERITPRTLEQEPILILRALALKAREFVLSEALEEEVRSASKTLYEARDTLTPQTRSQLNIYFGNHLKIGALPEYKDYRIEEVLSYNPKKPLSLPFAETRKWADVAEETMPRH